jgi:hypothetical protein
MKFSRPSTTKPASESGTFSRRWFLRSGVDAKGAFDTTFVVSILGLRFASLRQNAVVEDTDVKAPRGLDKPRRHCGRYPTFSFILRVRFFTAPIRRPVGERRVVGDNLETINRNFCSMSKATSRASMQTRASTNLRVVQAGAAALEHCDPPLLCRRERKSSLGHRRLRQSLGR